MDIKTVETLVKLFKEEGLSKLKVSGDDGSVHIEKNFASNTSQNTAESNETSGGEEKDTKLLEVTATQVGTFYTNKEEEGDEPFVNVGDHVSEGDTVGLIEAMKVFNEVTAEHKGIIEEILVKSGDVVEYGQTIMTLKPEED